MPDPQPVDVLISYKSEERPVAARLAAALSAKGWHVWWDHHIVAGDAYRRVIAEKLQQARCVVVLWSSRSVESDFVLDEAARAHRLRTLVPVRIEAVDIPLGFGQQDYTDLIDWDGDPTHPGFDELCRAIAGRLSGVPSPMPAPVSQVRPWFGGRRTWVLAAGVAAILLVGAALLWRGGSPDGSASGPGIEDVAATGTGDGAAVAADGAGGVPSPTVTGGSLTSPVPLAVQIAVAAQTIATALVLPSGHVITPCHVVGEAETVELRGAGRWDGAAHVVARRCDVDLVLLEPAAGLMRPNTTVVRFAGSLAVGDAIERYRSVSDRTPGRVLAIREASRYLGNDGPTLELLATTHVSAGGDSGAPILDDGGRVVGMLVAGDGATKSLAIPTETMRTTFIEAFTP
ncbi:MAG: TIR domain-containing protein [Vicinamibacterales bacterium]